MKTIKHILGILSLVVVLAITYFLINGGWMLIKIIAEPIREFELEMVKPMRTEDDVLYYAEKAIPRFGNPERIAVLMTGYPRYDTESNIDFCHVLYNLDGRSRWNGWVYTDDKGNVVVRIAHVQ